MPLKCIISPLILLACAKIHYTIELCFLHLSVIISNIANESVCVCVFFSVPHHEVDSTDEGRTMFPAGLVSDCCCPGGGNNANVDGGGGVGCCCCCSNGFPARQAAHGHGPPRRLASTERNLRAGPNFMPSECIRWSSVSSGRPEPSIC